MQPDNQPNRPPFPGSTGQPEPSPAPGIPQTTGDPNPAPPVDPVPTGPTVMSAPPKKKKSKKKLFAVIALVAILLLGGSAAAYLGYYVPNQPENVLKQAIENTSKEKQAKFDGNFEIESLDEENPYAANIKFNGQGDTGTGNTEAAVEVNVSGVKVTLDAKIVDKSVYVKVGDLSGVKGLAALAIPGAEAIIDEANKKLANQWIEIDETLLKTAKADCALEVSKMTFSDQDFQLLESKYQDNQFATIKSTSNEDVKGKGSIKYEIELDNKKLEEYGKNLNDLSVVKKARECAGEEANNSVLSSDEGKTSITLWVEKDRKLINKLAYKTSPEMEKEEKAKGSLEVTVDYTPVQITKPENARPLMEILGELEGLSKSLQGGQIQEL